MRDTDMMAQGDLASPRCLGPLPAMGAQSDVAVKRCR